MIFATPNKKEMQTVLKDLEEKNEYETAKKYNRISCEINAVSDEEFEDDFEDDDFESEEYEDTDDFLGDITIYFEINNFSRRKSNGHINNK